MASLKTVLASSVVIGLSTWPIVALAQPAPDLIVYNAKIVTVDGKFSIAQAASVTAGKFSADQLRQFAQAAQQDPLVKGYRSFANLAEGKALCVMEAPNKDAVAAWFTKVGMPFETITKVELEGERGSIQPA